MRARRRLLDMGLSRIAIAIAWLLVVQAAQGDRRATHAAVGIADTETFYAAVRENLARAQRVAHEFSYKERRTSLHTNPFGRLGTGGTELYQVYPATNPALTYRRLLARDGVPITEAELAAQDREHRARTVEARRRLRNENDEARRRRKQDEADARRRAQAMIEDVVAALQFTIEGRGEHESRSAVVVAFVRNPQVRPRTREGEVAQTFAGTIWIDAALNEVMHLEATLNDDIAFGFGIVARLNRGATASLTRRPVEGNLWMPTRLRMSGNGRALLFMRKLAIDHVVEWFDYQRLDHPTLPDR